MTRLYDEKGVSIPVTVLEAGPCFVSQVKGVESDGYDAVQLAYQPVKGRSSTVPMIGHDGKAGLGPMRHHREVPASGADGVPAELGRELTVGVFEDVKFVDVVGHSKGKGFAGGMKRWGFKGQLASHGVERKHRSPGSVGGRSSNLGTGKPKKGIKMAGRLGGGQVTARSMEVVGIDSGRNLLLVKGTVPGAKNGVVLIREARRLNKQKARRLAGE